MSTAEILDLPTLAAVHREVDARAADWRAAWRMHGPGSPAANAMFDQRLVRAEVFEHLRVEDGRADLVCAHRPLAEIDLAAAVAAEGEVLAVAADKRIARGAVENLGGFLLRRHEVERVSQSS